MVTKKIIPKLESTGNSHNLNIIGNNEVPIDWFKLYHEQNLHIWGIHIPGADIYTCKNEKWMYREFRLQFTDQTSNLDPVSLKLAMVKEDMTPYSYLNNELYYKNDKLSFKDTNIFEIPILPVEDFWHLKGYTFPFRGSKNPYFELRLNLRITGYCPGKCFFCHRTHSHLLKPEERRVADPQIIIERISKDEGSDIFSKITRIMFISELFGKEEKFINAVKATREELMKRGYPIENEFNCCAHDVRSLKGHKILRTIVKPDRYSFTLEFFRDRDILMGAYKGIPIKKVYEVLKNARSAGFKEIQLNYMAGIDSLEECKIGFERLKEYGLVDSVGLSTFTFFSNDQMKKRHPDAWDPCYYLSIVDILNSLGIKIYKPKSYDMGCAYTVLMNKTIL